MKLEEGFKKEKVAVRPPEGFRRNKKTHAFPTFIEGVKSKKIT